MKILAIQVLRGPNIWSVTRKKLIQMRLDLEEMEERPTNLITGFNTRLQQLLPSMQSHRCSYNCAGGFFRRVDDGTWMGHVIEHIALEIQTLAGMDVGFGRTRMTSVKGIYNVVFAYLEEKVGIFAAERSVAIAQALINNEPYNLDDDIHQMRLLRERESLGPSTASIVHEAVNRRIPYIRLNKHSLVQLGYGKNQVRFRATISDKTSNIAVDIAGNKPLTKQLLEDAAIPVAKGETLWKIEDVEPAVKRLGFPLVFKPVNGNHGRGATIGIKTLDEAIEAYKIASAISRDVIAERFISGDDYRVLVVDNKLVAAARRDPAHVTGDGVNTIEQLIDIANQDPRRGIGHEKMLTLIQVDRDTRDLLNKNGLTLETIPAKGQKVQLKSTANLSTGGTSADVTDLVHPQNVFFCERISRIIGLDICGIDIMAPNLTQPLTENGGVVLEVNAAPGFRMHLDPTEGLPRNVAESVVDMMYPTGKEWSIPIIAVTGTNGKTTTTRLIAHIIKSNGTRVGFTTSDGIYVQNQMVAKGDTTGPNSAEIILKDPSVEFAVLETARGGILRTGLAFGSCDIGIITNIQEDHLGISDINTLADLKRVKAVVAGAVKRKGWAVLNADNKYCVEIAKDTIANVAYFSMDENNPVVKEHCKRGLVAAVFENGFITIKKGTWKIRIDQVVNIPLTFGGTAHFMIENVLAATLATFLWGYKIDDIRLSLETFIPSAVMTPGRMNLFHYKDFTLLLDFAHNANGFNGVKDYLNNIEATEKIGIISGTGDRSDFHIKELGMISAQMFDKIYICQEKYLRGRSSENIVNLLIQGIEEVRPGFQPVIDNNGDSCLTQVLAAIKPKSFLVVLSNTIENVAGRISDRLNEHPAS